MENALILRRLIELEIHRAFLIPLICANVIWLRYEWPSLDGKGIGLCLVILLCWSLLRIILIPENGSLRSSPTT